MGYRVEVRDRQEGVRRTMVAPTISQNDPAKIVFFDREVYGLKQRVFDCERILAQVTQEQCAASYLRNNIGSGCHNCSIGRHFSGGAPIAEDRHSAINKSLGLACVRCERDGHTATRYVGRFRLVKQHTICISCANREYELANKGGLNSKGMPIKKWAHLTQATITIDDAAGEQKTLDIGLRLDYLECARYVERVHPGATLIETAIGGAIIPQFSLWTPLPFSPWEPCMVRDEKPSKPKRTYTHRVKGSPSKPRPVVSEPVDWDDWDTPLYAKPTSSEHSDADGNGNLRRCGWLPPMSEEDDAAYRASFNEPALDPESIASFWDGMNADGLPDFIEWLGITAWQRNPLEAPSPVADAIALPEVAGPAVSASEQTERESEWAGCYLVRDGVTTYVCDYAKERGISDEEAAIVLGMCDPDYSDEPEPAAAPEPEPAPEPAKAEPAPIPKKLTGKQLRKLEKAQRRAERQQAQQKPTGNMRAKDTAIAARAYALLQGVA
jgi:hypothetical protein